MKACLTMSGSFHTPVDFWLELTIPELYQWASVARDLSKEREEG
jgi:hypothetical protein